MSGVLSYQDSETARRLRTTAAAIFAHHGIDFNTAREGGGWTNASWIAGGLVLRLSLAPEGERIRHEARLAVLLPPEAGYPAIIATGVTDGREWALAREIPGRSLGAAWEDLTWEERASALIQLWNKANAVHSVDLAALDGLARERAWFNSNDPVEAQAGLDHLAGQGILTMSQAVTLRAALDRFWKALSTAACALNHGDLTLDNAIWHAGRVVSLLDFEWAVIAPPLLDLNTFLKHAFGPPPVGGLLTESEQAGRQRLRRAAKEVSAPLLAQPGAVDLLLGYGILLELWMLQDWLAHPDGEGPLEGWEPYRRLLSLADGNGGYLAEVLALADQG